jgi:DNA helicase-2/ATP-dependent DNA helicase PcrA
MNALTRSLEHALREHGVPYQMVNAVEFYQRKEIKDVLAYLALVNNPRDDIAFLRVINAPSRKIGKVTLKRLMQHAASRGLPLLDAAREAGVIPGIATRTAIEIAKFVALMDQLSVLASRPVEEIVGNVLAESGYKQQFENSEHLEDQERLANIEELLTAARQFDEHHPGDGGLEEFLEGVSLVNDTDAFEVDHERVTLMTLHASKGLEFPVVFIIGLEEGIVPHERGQHDPAQLEEERRLLFVGITRAQQELQLSRAIRREFRGRRGLTVPSSFLMELPREEMEVDERAWSVAAPSEAEQYELATAGESEWSQLDGGDDAWESPRAGEQAVSAATMSGPRNGSSLAGLQTAAQLAESRGESPAAPETAASRMTTALAVGPARGATRPMSPEVFHQGMAVVHPEYGLGKIVALSGTGDQRKATVAFVSDAGQRTFVLRVSPLKPAVRPA